MQPALRHYRTEAPFVVAKKCGDVVSTHYEAKAAIAAAKQGSYRSVCARDRGQWLIRLVYENGLRKGLP